MPWSTTTPSWRFVSIPARRSGLPASSFDVNSRRSPLKSCTWSEPGRRPRRTTATGRHGNRWAGRGGGVINIKLGEPLNPLSVGRTRTGSVCKSAAGVEVQNGFILKMKDMWKWRVDLCSRTHLNVTQLKTWLLSLHQTCRCVDDETLRRKHKGLKC